MPGQRWRRRRGRRACGHCGCAGTCTCRRWPWGDQNLGDGGGGQQQQRRRRRGCRALCTCRARSGGGWVGGGWRWGGGRWVVGINHRASALWLGQAWARLAAARQQQGCGPGLSRRAQGSNTPHAWRHSQHLINLYDHEMRYAQYCRARSYCIVLLCAAPPAERRVPQRHRAVPCRRCAPTSLATRWYACWARRCARGRRPGPS